ncbi:hypothetical protein PPERSA_01845 [Pseudocohnilembus persalinus]|uniref:Uncharacterized protein n=1 Tax=Pseudocohnilembus persalinus TaxID=266149 RepID=A0A0V0R2T2_PSEPJ|nr:hypothetical protein PPERSA_01845 [Pseudocohnilembus persalinus]|eukprot:KRX08592.1 hypothetical protein PPERSA_01845 [Pseudocohnilembus persalinus]
MAEKDIIQCKKEGHQCQKYLYLNMSSENKNDLFFCPTCIQEKYLDQGEIQQKNQKTLQIKQLKNDKLKKEDLIGWPPIQEQDHQKIYQNHTKMLEKYGQENQCIFNYYKEKVNDFYLKLKTQILEEIRKQQKETIIQLENYCENYFQNLNSNQDFINLQETIKLFDIKDFREKFQEFQKKKIDIDQFFDYKQQQNSKVYNNNKIYNSLQTQQEKVEELKKELEKEFAQVNESLNSFKKQMPNIKAINKTQQQYKQQQQQKKQQQLKLYKSDYDKTYNEGNFEIDNDARTIKLKTNGQKTYIYSENLKREKEYHLRFTMDTKNNFKNIRLAFSLTSGNEKNSKNLETDHYVRLINYMSNSFAEGGEFQVIGKKFKQFFKDNETIVNLVFNIENKMMEIYDDNRFSYQKLIFDEDEKFDEWILGIFYYQRYSNYSEVNIQFID